MGVDVIIEDVRWEPLGLSDLAARATDAALQGVSLEPADWSVSVLGCDDARIAALNAGFRAKSQPTNVLSWPSEDRAADRPGARPAPPDRAEEELGDIAIAYETCTREAQAAGITAEDHVLHLIVHATLHLLGYDHETDSDADLMESLESTIVGRMGLADPYRLEME